MAIETANLAGLSQAGAPVMMRGSSQRPTADGGERGEHQQADGGQRRAGLPQARQAQARDPVVIMRPSVRPDVVTVNITIAIDVDSVNICSLRWSVPDTRSAGPRRKTAEPLPPRRPAPRPDRGGAADHPGRRRATALTLRGVGAALGVSRTALYRHFADKSALLAAVAREGFRTLRLELLDGVGARRARTGRASRRWARPTSASPSRTPSHYRVMFGGFVDRQRRPRARRGGGRRVSGAGRRASSRCRGQGWCAPTTRCSSRGSSGRSCTASRCSLIDGLLGPKADAEAFTRFAIARVTGRNSEI